METCSELQPKLTCLKASGSSAEPPTWSLRQEVDRLIEDHSTGSSHRWSLDPKPDKHGVSLTSSDWGGVTVKLGSADYVDFISKNSFGFKPISSWN